jgi:hypothetical protein
MDKSKERAKAAQFGVSAFVSSTALLDSIKQAKEAPKTEIWDLVENKLMDSGGQIVYPNQPFKYGYKRIYTNKKHLRNNPIGISAPLTDKKLKIVADFVGLTEPEQCDSDAKYLKILKSLLTQRCNVQNPDELSWGDILAHIAIFSQKTEHKTKPGEGDKRGDKESDIIISNNEPLSDKALAVLKLLQNLPPNKALTGPKILKQLDTRKIFIDQSTLTKSIIPALKAHGVKNKPRLGYYIEKN